MRSNIDDLLIVDVALAEAGYNYYSYLSSGTESRSMIVREKLDETEYRYFFGKGSNYDADWAARATKAISTPNNLTGRG